ncbi:hypothetical protein [Nocardioides antri]|uniref:Mce-associated membrane protein n=1 Tax=Nocardioides antri TaxID=2607659 RepID=A0A5B1M9K1_9ACTN|nr:hypothetical protein [Nocardioides antri]KAA1429116.1 hypothetical protein F0U47_02645 [Nocardioides antri]
MSAQKVRILEDTPERRYQLAIVVLLVLVLVVASLAIWLVSKKNAAEDDLEKAEADIETYQAGPDARDAAEEILLEMTSYDYRRIEDEYAWLDHFANDELRGRFEKQVPNLKKVIRRSKARARGEVVQSAYNTIDSTSATVLAFVRQRLTDATNRRGVLEDQWTTLTLVREGDEWLIEDIDIVTVPPPS